MAAEAFALDAFSDRAARDTAIADWFAGLGVELVVCAGYMHLLEPSFLARFPGRVVNVHPAPLPAFPGAHPLEDVLAAGANEAAATVHYVDEGVDTGAVIASASRTRASGGHRRDPARARARGRASACSPRWCGSYARADLRLRQDRARNVRARTCRARRRARGERRHGGLPRRRRARGHEGREPHRVPRDPGWPREDTAPAGARRDPRPARCRGGRARTRGARDRAVRPRVRQPLSLRGGGCGARSHRGGGGRADRRRRAGDAARSGQELRALRARVAPGGLRARARGARERRGALERHTSGAGRRAFCGDGSVRGRDRALVLPSARRFRTRSRWPSTRSATWRTARTRTNERRTTSSAECVCNCSLASSSCTGSRCRSTT